MARCCIRRSRQAAEVLVGMKGFLVRDRARVLDSPQMNNWGISAEAEAKTRKRDKFCVYCGTPMKLLPKARGAPKKKTTWEHINNGDLNPKHLMNIVLCCGECNASKGAKTILEWFVTDYCKKKRINANTGGCPSFS
jgi:5-methylcytosine-specific restriction endonuclease McrA